MDHKREKQLFEDRLMVELSAISEPLKRNRKAYAILELTRRHLLRRHDFYVDCLLPSNDIERRALRRRIARINDSLGRLNREIEELSPTKEHTP